MQVKHNESGSPRELPNSIFAFPLPLGMEPYNHSKAKELNRFIARYIAMGLNDAVIWNIFVDSGYHFVEYKDGTDAWEGVDRNKEYYTLMNEISVQRQQRNHRSFQRCHHCVSADKTTNEVIRPNENVDQSKNCTDSMDCDVNVPNRVVQAPEIIAGELKGTIKATTNGARSGAHTTPRVDGEAASGYVKMQGDRAKTSKPKEKAMCKTPKDWSNDPRLPKAIAEVDTSRANGEHLMRKIAKKYGIPKSTLQRRANIPSSIHQHSCFHPGYVYY